MRAMVLTKQKQTLQLKELPIPKPDSKQILIQVLTCGICRTDLHIIDGDLPYPKLPLIPGHQIVGIVAEQGNQAHKFQKGQRVGAAWLGGSCNVCEYCLQGKENLCDKALYTGYQTDGGFAEYCVANEDYCFSLPESYSSVQAAPLLCAGFIGFRAFKMTENAKRLGFYGFGASAHILAQVARYRHVEVYAFTRKADVEAQELAKKLGATWSGDSTQTSPVALDAAILFAPVGALVPIALRSLKKAGIAICAGIHMSDIPSFPYSLLWEERVLRSVANLTREDGREFLDLATRIPIKTNVTTYPLEKTNEALRDLKEGRFTGAGVIQISKEAVAKF